MLLDFGVVFLLDYCELRRPLEKGTIDSESQGDTLRHHRAAKSYLNSCSAVVRAGIIRTQLLRHSETTLPKRRKFDHLAALLAVVRQVPSVHEPLVPFAPVGDREARVLSAPEPLPAQRSECVWNPPKHTPLRCQHARPRLVCASRQRRTTVLSLSPLVRRPCEGYSPIGRNLGHWRYRFAARRTPRGALGGEVLLSKVATLRHECLRYHRPVLMQKSRHQGKIRRDFHSRERRWRGKLPCSLLWVLGWKPS